MTERPNKDDFSPSICEEALNRFSESEDSLAGVIEQHSIAVRDFMMLSLVCDQTEMHLGQLGRALGLNNESVVECVGRLLNAGLVKTERETITTTAAGRLIAQRILDTM